MHRILIVLSLVILGTFSAHAYHERIEGNFGRDHSVGDTCSYVPGAGMRCASYGRSYPEYRIVETSRGPVRVRNMAVGYSPWGSQRSAVYSPTHISGKFKRRTIYVRLP